MSALQQTLTLPVATDDVFASQALTQSCHELFGTTEHVVLGISPFNSYFRTDRIIDMIDWSRNHFSAIDFFTPDEAASYTLQAQGYEAAKAAKKTRSQTKYVHNKVRTAIAEAELDDHDGTVWGLAQLRENARYNALRGEAADRFASDLDLRREIMATSTWILAGKLPAGHLPTEEQVLLAVEYFLDELPLFVDSPGIFGVEQSCFVYHQRVEFLEKFFSRQLTWQPAPGQSFRVVQPLEDSDLI